MLGGLLRACRKDGRADVYGILENVRSVRTEHSVWYASVVGDDAWAFLNEDGTRKYLDGLLFEQNLRFCPERADREEKERQARIDRLDELSGGILILKD